MIQAGQGDELCLPYHEVPSLALWGSFKHGNYASSGRKDGG